MLGDTVYKINKDKAMEWLKKRVQALTLHFTNDG